MPPVKTTTLDTRYFRCAAYNWEISITRTVELPDQEPRFTNPIEAWEYFTKIKRTYTVKDGNVSGGEDIYPTYAQAWYEFCRCVKGYAQAFTQLGPTGALRLDLPDPNREEPIQ